MKRTRTPLVAGNWKMHPVSLRDAKALFVGVRAAVKKKRSEAEVVVAPPFPFISELSKLSPSGAVRLGAQDVFYENVGARTGEVSPTMLASLGVSYVIIGHSERRALGETDEAVGKKVEAAQKAKLTTIVCVGEEQRDAQGNFFSLVSLQLKHALAHVTPKQAKQLVIAYEPVWAIGTGTNPTPAEVEEMALFIKKELTKRLDRSAAGKVRILYGGSVKPGNAAELFAHGGIDGFLVGGASLNAADFAGIFNAV